MGKGESEAIVLAKELKANFVLLDDRAARRIARQENLPIIGRVGILLLAKENKLIPAVKPSLDALLAIGIYMDENLYREAKRLADN